MKDTEKYLRQAVVDCGFPEDEYKLVLGKSMLAKHTEKRKAVATKLRSYGFSYPKIGRIMERHHTSVMNLINEKRRKVK